MCGPWDPYKAALVGRLKEQYKGKFAQPVRSAMHVGCVACDKQGAVHEQAHSLFSAPSAVHCPACCTCKYAAGQHGYV